MIQGVAEEVETRDGRVEGQALPIICIVRQKENLASLLGIVNAARHRLLAAKGKEKPAARS